MSFLALSSCGLAPVPTTDTPTAPSTSGSAPATSTTGTPLLPRPRPAFAEGSALYDAAGGEIALDSGWRIIAAEEGRGNVSLASDLSDTIRKSMGYGLEYSEDKVVDGSPYYYLSEHEICIGRVRNRDGYDALSGEISGMFGSTDAVGCFAVAVRDGKIYLTSPDDAGTAAAVSFFVSHYAEEKEKLPESLVSLYYYDKSALQTTGKFSFIDRAVLLSESGVMGFLKNGAPMAAFDRAQTQYDLLLASDAAVPAFKILPVSPFAEVTVDTEKLPSAAEGEKLTYTVTAADGSSSVTYTIIWQRGDFTTVQATLHRLKNGATGALTIVQDDGFDKTTEFMLSVCRENGLKFNIAMIANRVGTLAKNPDGTYATDENGNYICSANDNASTAWWQKIVAENADYIEISSHSYTHGAWGLNDNNVSAEILGSQQLLRTVFPGQRVLTFAYPGFSSSIREQEYSLAKGMMPGYYVGARYLSTGMSASLIDPDYFWLGANSFYYSDPAKWGDTSVKNEMTWYINQINRAVTSGSWIVTMNHMIVESLPTTDRNIQITQEYFRYAIETVALPYIREGKLWNGFFSEVARYVYEYNHCDMNAYRYDDGHYEVKISFDAEVTSPELYDYPLTVDLPVDAGWQHVTFSYTARDGSTVTETLTVETAEDGSSFVRLQVVPLCTATVTCAD